MKSSIKTYIVLIYSFFISLPLASETTENTSVINFLLEIQDRNFGRSVNFCQKDTPNIESLYKKYMDDFSEGAQAAFANVEGNENLREFTAEDGLSSLLEISDKQGLFILQQIQSNPERGCQKLLKLVSNSSPEAAENKVSSIYGNYLKEREKYCSQKPKPSNCT